MLQEHYPNHIHLLRRRRRLSQKQLTELIGLEDRTMISKYERGHVVPTLEVAAKLQIIFGVNATDIFPRLFKQWRYEIVHAKGARKTVRGASAPREDHS